MDRNTYYEELKALAREKRALHGVNTQAFGLREMRRIYKAEGIRIDSWPLRPKIKAMYMCEDGDYSVAVQRTLPDEPKLFALAHELKHHYRDQDVINGTGGYILCGDYNANEMIEKGAEVFAAEFIYPAAEFVEDLARMNVKTWHPEDVVHFKRQTKAKVSYKYICKRLEWMNLIERGEFDGIQFQKLEEQMFGVPFWKARRGRRPRTALATAAR